MRYTPHIIAALLLLAWLDMPYGYYQFLRLAVSAYATYLLIQHSAGDSPRKELYIIASAALVILYQPLFKIPLDREIWQWANLATVGVVYLMQPQSSQGRNN